MCDGSSVAEYTSACYGCVACKCGAAGHAGAYSVVDVSAGAACWASSGYDDAVGLVRCSVG